MKKRETMRDRTITNEYGVSTTYKLEKEFYDIQGKEYNIEYLVSSKINATAGGGYFRKYKRLANALKDSYVEEYLEEEN